MAKSEDRLLVGITASGHVGVDLEPAHRQAHDPLGVARRYFSRAETEALAAMDSDRLHEAFLRSWACKEAVVKASGHGIANQLCRFTVETDPDLRPAVLDFMDDDHAGWTLEMARPDDDFVGAVAAAHSDMIIKPFRLVAA
jgi:4'-phosphopantetheinyl transferase